MGPLAPFLALLAAAATAAELRPCAHDSCPGDVEDSGAGLLQHAIQLVDAGASQASSSSARAIGLHYMMLLRPFADQGLTLMDAFVENVLSMETCFSEILVTLDHGTWMQGEDLNARRKIPGAALGLLNRSSATAWFFCGMKDRTRYLAQRLEEQCGGQVSTGVHILDVSLPHVQDAALRIFGSRELPSRVFKNTFAYLYGPAAMKSDYIVHLDDDMLIKRKKARGTFVEQALQVLDHSTAASVNMPCCTCQEVQQNFTQFADSKQAHFSGLEVGQMNFTDPHPERAFPVPGVDVQSLCTTMQNFITMQVYVLHTERFRKLFPMRVRGVQIPAMLHIECLLTGAAASTVPPTVFAWIGRGASQCRRLRRQIMPETNIDPKPSSELGRCMGSPAKEAEVL